MSEQNRNLMLFMVLSLGLMGIYYWMQPKPQPGQAPRPAVQAEASPAPAAAPAPSVPAPAVAPADPAALVKASNPALELSWRKQDGALVQAIWKADGTPFFPSATDPKSAPFMGIGGSLGARFEGEPELTALPDGRQELSFRNGAGDRLVYRIPAKGHVLEMVWDSPQHAPIHLLPKPQDTKPVHNLGRVFTLQEKDIKSVTWNDMLTDPLFSSLGRKRKELPPEASRLGLDAGLEKGVAAQTNHYFAAIWDCSRVPERDAQSGFRAATDANGHLSARLYLGPKQAEALAAFGPAFKQVLDFGFFGMVAKLMFWILWLLHGGLPSWGWTLVVFSVLIRMALWPLNTKTTISMMRMKELEPHQKALQAKYEKFGNDMQKKAEMQKELMAFYKKNGHNPMGGCLPMLLQMPVFLALWSMLNNVFELRGASFLWLKDLSHGDVLFRLPIFGMPIGVLPILLGASMVAQSALTPATGDPAQRKMMMWMMPAMMVLFFASTPSGLCLYYLIFNFIGLVQTWWVVKTYKPQPVVL